MRQKICITSTVFLFLTYHLSAQLETGNIYTHLMLGKREVRYSSSMVRPSVSLALSKHSSIGVFFEYTKFKDFEYYDASAGYNTGRAFQYSVGVSYNYLSFFNNKSKWGWYVNGSLSYNHFEWSQKESGGTTLSDHLKFSELAVTPGIFFKPSTRISLYANVGGVAAQHYQRSLNFQSNFASQLNLGVSLRLGKRKK
jgi:hypothetical protein